MDILTAAGAATSPRRAIARVQYLPLPAGWPLYIMLAGFPVCWALGLGSFALPALAAPMVVDLVRRRPIKLPRGFGIWLLFLFWVLVSFAALDLRAPGTIEGELLNRIVSASSRLLSYAAATVTLLYVGNLTAEEMPRRKLVALLGVFFLEVAGLGCVALAFPQLSFTSPFELILPGSLRNSGYVEQLVHPRLAQNMEAVGITGGRPAAPFPYTNGWGNVVATLLVWFVVWWWAWGGNRRKVAAVAVVAVAAVPIIYSLNRGVWIALIAAALYVSARMALQGRGKFLAAMLAGFLAIAAVVAVSPLEKVIVDRVQNGHSNAGRAAQDMLAIEGAASSPIIGYGSTRNMAGSRQSIAVGKSADCPACGNSSTGGAGQIWLLVFSQGFVGAALYLGFFGYVLWRYRRDHSPIGMAASTVIVMSFVYLPFYGAVGMPLTLSFVAVGLLWRNAAEGAATDPARSLAR